MSLANLPKQSYPCLAKGEFMGIFFRLLEKMFQRMYKKAIRKFTV